MKIFERDSMKQIIGLFLKPLCIIYFSLVLSSVYPSLLLATEKGIHDSIAGKLKDKSAKEQLMLLLNYAEQLTPVDPAAGLILSKKAEEIARKERSPLLLSDALKIKADALFYLDSLSESVDAYIESAGIDQKSGNSRPDSVLRRIGDAGYVFFRMGWFDKAIEYHERALDMSRKQKDTAEIATNLFNIGLSYNMTGRYDKAIEYMQIAINLDELTGNIAHLSTNYNALGMVYFSWGKNDKALEFLNEAITLDIKSGDENKLAIRLSNISKILLTENRLQEARQTLEQSLEIERRLNNQTRAAIRMHGLGLVHTSLGEYQKALDYLNQALEIFQNYNLDYKIAGLKVQIGNLYQDMEDFPKAEKAYNEGYNLAVKFNLRPEAMDAAKSLYQHHKNQNKFADALYYLEINKSLQDSLFSERSAEMIHDFEVKYETEKKEKQNQLLSKENEIQKRTQRFYLFTIITLVFLSTSLFWAFSLKKKALLQSRILHEKESEVKQLKIDAAEKRSQHLQELLFAEEEIRKLQAKTLEQKNHELTTSAMLIANKNDTLVKLKKLAEKLKDSIVGKGKNELREMIREIDRQSDMDDQWDQFKLHFEAIHKSFFNKLKESCPNITRHDMQHCAYIKLNISTKEIARLMNISPESVNTHRYRLRKKFNLIEKNSLDDYIHSL
jgi:tetratricopeptide (TPR) repeat protein